LNAFISLLINNLRSTKKSTGASYFNDKPAAAKPAMSIASASTIAAPMPPSIIAAASLRSKKTTPPTQFKSERETPAELRSIKQSQQAVKRLETEIKDEEQEVPPIVSEHSYSSVSVRPVKGSNKLQKRMHAVDQAIDAERLVSQIKQNVEASYEDDNEEEFKTAVNIVKEDSADEFEHL
jgi:hypothetical protein